MLYEVITAVAERAGWGRPAPKGIHRGLAHMKAFNSYVAACAEISVSGGNKVKIHRIVCATDTSYAVNPAQIERHVITSYSIHYTKLYDFFLKAPNSSTSTFSSLINLVIYALVSADFI